MFVSYPGSLLWPVGHRRLNSFLYVMFNLTPLMKHNIMFLNEWLVKGAQPITAIQHLTKEKKQQTQKTPKSEKTTKQLLGEFYSDKKYLENLLKDEGTVPSYNRIWLCLCL